MHAAPEIEWDLVEWDDMTTWPEQPVTGWPQQYQLQAKAALIRSFSKIGIQVEPHNDTYTYTIVNPGHFRLPLTHGDDALEFLDGFLAGCEAMNVHYVCTERDADELD